jgi:threonine synthase
VLSLQASTTNQPSRNPRLAGLRCIACGTAAPLSLAHAPCTPCATRGQFVSLAADYGATAGTRELPYGDVLSLGEGYTPWLERADLAKVFGAGSLWVKDESRNPSGSHKDRMSAMGVAQALDMGAHTVVLASSGNAAVSAALYAQAAGLRCEVACYHVLADAYRERLQSLNAQLFAFETNAERWAYVAARAREDGVLALTNHHLPALGSAPLAIEGYKTIAWEMLDEGPVPKHVLVPTARGDLAWGIWRGFVEACAPRQQPVPRIWVVEPFARLSQALAGAPVHSSFPGNTRQFSTAGATITHLQWQAARDSGGGAVVANDEEALAAQTLLAERGVSAELCAAGAFSAIRTLRARGDVAAADAVAVVLTAAHTFA